MVTAQLPALPRIRDRAPSWAGGTEDLPVLRAALGLWPAGTTFAEAPSSLYRPSVCHLSPENTEPVDLSWDDCAEAGGPGVAPDQEEAAEGGRTTHAVNYGESPSPGSLWSLGWPQSACAPGVEGWHECLSCPLGPSRLPSRKLWCRRGRLSLDEPRVSGDLTHASSLCCLSGITCASVRPLWKVPRLG